LSRCAHTPLLVAGNGLGRARRRYLVECSACGCRWGPYADREEALRARVRIGIAALATVRRLAQPAGGGAGPESLDGLP
jgi:hypothetical protein